MSAASPQLPLRQGNEGNHLFRRALSSSKLPKGGNDFEFNSACRLRRSSVPPSLRGVHPQIQAAHSQPNNILTQGNAMKVFVRVRPYSQREIAQNPAAHSTVRICLDNPSVLSVLDLNRDYRPLATYNFTRCFWSVFERSVSDVESNRVMNGLRNTVDAYLNNSGAGARRLRRTASRSQNIDAAGDAAYAGAGSNATVTEANVSHPPYASQAEVYQHVGYPILQNTIDGYNGCVFAYGQTGSGKTFTMLGYAPDATDIRRRRESIAVDGHRSSDMAHSHDKGGVSDENQQAVLTSRSALFDQLLSSSQTTPMNTDDGIDVVDKNGMDPNELQGIIPRIASDLFKLLKAKREQDPSCSYRVEISYYEIYQDKVYDLVRPQKNANLKIRHHPSSGPYVDGLFHKVVMTEEDVARIIRRGMQERHTAATKFNDRSSRSHAILTFDIVQLFLDGSDNPNKMQSKLNLVDLAGSERSGQAGVDRPEYEEGIKINQSLTVLGRVIDCLADLSQNKSLSVPVPYRDSKLTLLLMDSIGGNSQTAMVATISPHQINYEEMRQTIRYASRAKQIMNRAVINEDPQVQQIKLLTAEIERLRQLLKEAGAHEFTHDYVLNLKKKCLDLEKKCEDDEKLVGCLRAELEMAMRSGAAKRRIGNGAEEIEINNATLHYRTNALQLKLQAANSGSLKRQKELRERAKLKSGTLVSHEPSLKGIPSPKKQCSMKESIFFCDFVLRYYDTLQRQQIADLIFSSIQDKVALFIREKQLLLPINEARLPVSTNEGHASILTVMSAIQEKHELELKELLERNRDALDAAQAHCDIHDSEIFRKHAQLLNAFEKKLQSIHVSHALEKKRLEQERDAVKLHLERLLVETRVWHEEALWKMRDSALGYTEDHLLLNDTLRQQQKKHEEMATMHKERSEAEKAYGTAFAELYLKLTAEASEGKMKLHEKEWLLLQMEREVLGLRQDNLNLRKEYQKSDDEKQRKIEDLQLQQESLIGMATNVTRNWEEKSPLLGINIAKLKELISNTDRSNFCLRARELAFRRMSSISGDAAGSTMPVPPRVESLKDFHDSMSHVQRVQEYHNHSMRKLKEVIFGEITRVRKNAPTPGNNAGDASKEPLSSETPESAIVKEM